MFSPKIIYLFVFCQILACICMAAILKSIHVIALNNQCFHVSHEVKLWIKCHSIVIHDNENSDKSWKLTESKKRGKFWRKIRIIGSHLVKVGFSKYVPLMWIPGHVYVKFCGSKSYGWKDIERFSWLLGLLKISEVCTLRGYNQ